MPIHPIDGTSTAVRGDDHDVGEPDRKRTRHRGAISTATLGLLAILSVLGCGESALGPGGDDERNEAVVESRLGDLVQTVEVSSTTLSPGDTLRVRSIIRNQGADRSVTYRICGLDLEGLDLETWGGRCGGYSASVILEAGDSVAGGDSRVVRSGPGVYELDVRHLLDPEQWVTVEVEVER